MAMRAGVLIAAGLALLAGLILWRLHGAIGAWLAVEAAVAVLAVLLERGRYRGNRERGGDWQATNEVFVDPTTGRRVRVHFDPKTGERKYEREPDQ